MENESLKAYKVLLHKIALSKQRNPRFSQRAYASKLGLSPGALSELVSGKRNLTADTKKKIANRLDLTPQERHDFFSGDDKNSSSADKSKYFQLTNDQFHLVSDWWHYGILNLIRTKNFKASTSWIAKRLVLPKQVVDEAWSRLFRMGLLEKTTTGVRRKHTRLETTHDHFDLSIQRSHLEDLRLIEKNIVEKPVTDRDASSITFVMNKKDIKLAKELIRKFQNQFYADVEPKEGDEVFKLSMFLYPLSETMETK